MMRERLVLIRELLAPDGSVWVHLDDAEMAYCRVLMDEVFGRQAFIATVLWQKSHTRENRTAISSGHEYIHVYAPAGPEWKSIRNVLPSSEEQLDRYTDPDGDPRGPWQSTPMHAKAEKGRRAEQFFTITTPSGRVVDPPPGRCWLFTRERYDELLADNRISFAGGEGVPRVKKFLSEVQAGLVPNSWWTHSEVGTTGTGKAEIVALFDQETPFSTPKPERLLERVIHIGSNPGDIVLDCFAGSGTTAAVAHKMGRRWVTVELSENTTDTFTKPRLEKVVAGTDPGGITESAGWSGGGGFRDLRVAASVWDVINDDLGIAVFQAEGMPDDTMARSVAAQLGYELIEAVPDESSVFVGAKGRSRLAVASGVVDAVAVADIVSALGEGETALIAALSNTEDAATTLAELSRGSRIMRMPSQLFPALGRVTR